MNRVVRIFNSNSLGVEFHLKEVNQASYIVTDVVVWLKKRKKGRVNELWLSASHFLPLMPSSFKGHTVPDANREMDDNVTAFLEEQMMMMVGVASKWVRSCLGGN